jgi:L-fuculose-phosphate aldolase
MTKIVVQLENRRVDLGSEADSMLRWCKRFHALGLAPVIPWKGSIASCGNASYRCSKGFVITASGKNMGETTKEDFVHVTSVDLKANTAFAVGRQAPSSEVALHARIYEARPDVNAVLHGHDGRIVENEGLFPHTEKSFEEGSNELAEAAAKALGKHDFVVLKGHGFVAVGKNLEQAGAIAEQALKQVRNPK